MRIGIIAAAILSIPLIEGITLSQEPSASAFDFAATETRALQGDTTAMVRLSNAYWGGQGAALDVEKGRAWLERASEKGSLQAEMLLGAAYLSGTKLLKDPQMAGKYLLAVAQQQSVEPSFQSSWALAQYWIALMYEHGNGVEKAHDKAIQYLQMAAANGNYPAQFDLASLYNEGSGGLAMDKTQACKLFEKAAEQGHVRAMHNVGYCYQVGTGGPKDDKKAIEYYTKAAEAGSTRSPRNLGMLFGQLGNADRAYFWLRVAQSLGDTEKASLIDVAKQHLTSPQVEQLEKDVAIWRNAHPAKGQ